MDKILFKKVIFNSFINKQIIYHMINDVNYRSINYKYCFNVSWLIGNSYFKLLACKLKNNEFLLLDKEKIDCVFAIKEIDLFVKCFKRFQVHFDAYGGVTCNLTGHGVLELAIENQNYDAFKFLFEHKYNFAGPFLLEYLVKSGCLSLIKDLCTDHIVSTHPDMISITCFLLAIESKRLDIVSFLFQHFQQYFSQQSLENRERILISSADSGDLDIFCKVQQYFHESVFLFSIRKSLVYNKEFLSKLFYNSFRSYQVYKFINDNFDLSFIQQENDTHPFYSAVPNSDKEVFQKLLDTYSKNINDYGIIEDICLMALICGDFDRYKLIREYFSGSLLSIPKSFRVSKMNNKSMENIKYVVEILKTPIYINDLIALAECPLHVFQFAYQHIDQSSISIFMVNRIISVVYRNRNLDILFYLSEQQVSFIGSNLWSDLEELDYLSVDISLLKRLVLIQPPKVDDLPALAEILQRVSQISQNIDLVKLFYEQVVNVSGDPVVDTRTCFSKAAKGGRIQTMKFLFEQQMTPNNFFKLLEEASAAGSLNIIKYLFENYNQPLLNGIESNPKILEKAILHNHLNCVEFLLPFYPKYDNLSFEVLRSINEAGNLLMVKYLYQSSQFNNKIHTVLNLCLQRFDHSN